MAGLRVIGRVGALEHVAEPGATGGQHGGRSQPAEGGRQCGLRATNAAATVRNAATAAEVASECGEAAAPM